MQEEDNIGHSVLLHPFDLMQQYGFPEKWDHRLGHRVGGWSKPFTASASDKKRENRYSSIYSTNRDYTPAQPLAVGEGRDHNLRHSAFTGAHIQLKPSGTS
jgi:hypothetical protein